MEVMMDYSEIRELSYEMESEIKRIYELFTPKGVPIDLDKIDELMEGAIDTQIHPTPDAYAACPFDDDEPAIQLCEMGMGQSCINAIHFLRHAQPD
jgi:hypothetical protein